MPVQIISTITCLTDPQLSHIMDIASRYDCVVNFEQLNPYFNADGTFTLRREDPGLNKVNKLIDYQLSNYNHRFIHSAYALTCVRNWPVSYNIFRLFKRQVPAGTKVIKCFAGRFSVVVEADGSLSPCCFIKPDYRQINIFKLGAKEAWRLMPENNCIACRSLGYNTANALFSLNISTIFVFFLKTKLINFFQYYCLFFLVSFFFFSSF